MKEIVVRFEHDETLTYLTRRAKELSERSGKKISRNQLINMIIEDDMKKFLSQNREVDMLKDSLDDFKHILQQYIDTNNALLYRSFEADGI